MQKEIVEQEVTYELPQAKAGRNVSWAAVFAGAVTFIAMELIFALISSAIGFGTADLYKSGSFADAGTGLLVWTVISLLLAFFISGLVAGIAAGRTPGLHGFLTWALAVFMILMLVASGVGAAVRGAAQLISGVGSVAVDVVGGAGEGIGKAVSAAADKASEQIEVKIDKQKVEADVEQILIDSEVPELQPDYLKNELSEASSEIQAAAKEAVKNPENIDQIAKDLIEKLKARADEIVDSVDKDAVAKAVAENSDLTEAEAKETTEKIIVQYEKTSKEAKEQLAKLEQNIEELRVEAEQTLAEAKQAANDAMNTAAKVSGYAAVALVLSIFVAMGGAMVGYKYIVPRFIYKRSTLI